jgi:hypothetical protein
MEKQATYCIECRSEKPCYAMYSYTGMLLQYVCVQCEKKAKAKYRPEVFTGITKEDY